MFKINGPFFDQGDGGGGGSSSSSADGSSDGNGAGDGLTFDAWLGKQDETVKGLLDGHTKGLKNALDTERATRKDLEKQVRDLATKAQAGSDAQKQLTELADRMAEGDRKAEFFDAAHRAGISNLKLAYTVAVTDDLFDKKGNVDFAKMKTAYPELFGAKKPPAGNAGDGTENTTGVADMNARIRKYAGRSNGQ